MEENNKIKQLMQLYFGKHFSRYGRILFGRWLKADDAKTEKEEMLQDLWKESQLEVTASTHSDWKACKGIFPWSPFVNVRCHSIASG